MIKEGYDGSHGPYMWTLKTALPIAEKLNAKIVGSVASRGKSNNDLDLWIKNYDHNSIIRQMELVDFMGFSYSGNQVVSPKEMKKAKFPCRKMWLKVEIFFDYYGRRIDIWHKAK